MNKIYISFHISFFCEMIGTRYKNINKLFSCGISDENNNEHNEHYCDSFN